MLIAIMSDTFGKVSEGQEQHKREMKISLLSDYVALIKKNDSTEQKNSYLVLVTSTEAAGEKSEWEGSLNVIKSTLEKSHATLKSDFDHKLDSLKSLILESKARATARDKDNKKAIAEVMRTLKYMSAKFEERE